MTNCCALVGCMMVPHMLCLFILSRASTYVPHCSFLFVCCVTLTCVPAHCFYVLCDMYVCSRTCFFIYVLCDIYVCSRTCYLCVVWHVRVFPHIVFIFRLSPASTHVPALVYLCVGWHLRMFPHMFSSSYTCAASAVDLGNGSLQ